MLRWLTLVVLVAQSARGITGLNPPTGACLCVGRPAVDVRSSACGTAVEQVASGRCFKYLGEKSRCSLNGVGYKFFKLQYGAGSGWIAGRYLKLGRLSQCLSSQSLAQDSCPRIVSRAEWGAKPPKSTTQIKRPIPKVFIHHAASAPCKTQVDCSRLVRQFQTEHQKKWDDIGYNFLVGEDGNAYEGRGWDLMGAHANRTWNQVSLGISVIGNFMNSQPNAAALYTVKQLIACGTSKDKISHSYTLHGHLDGCPTECPGTAFYNLIKTWPHYGGRLPAGNC